MENLNTIICLIIYVLYVIGLWKIFEKSGEKGWKSLIPFYNFYIISKLFWGKGLWFLLIFIPVVNIIFEIITMIKIGKSFKKSPLFIAGLIILPMIFIIILGFGKDEYTGVPEKLI